MGRQGRLDLRNAFRGRRRPARPRADRTGLRRARHLCRRLPQRREGARRRQHVPPLAHGGQTAAPSGRKHPESLFPLADQGRPAQIRLAALPLRGRQRSVGQRRAFRQTRQRLRPQGRLSLRMGLGTASGHIGHLAPRFYRSMGRCTYSQYLYPAKRSKQKPGNHHRRSRNRSRQRFRPSHCLHYG